MNPGSRMKNPQSIRERWLTFRNRLIATPAFQRRVAGFPLTRALTRRRTERLFDICAGFVYTQVLSACVSLNLFEELAAEPADIPALAARKNMSSDAMARLVRAATSLDLFEAIGDGRYTLGQLGAAVAGNPAISEMTSHHAMLYDDLADPIQLLRGEAGETQLSRFWGYGVTGTPADMSEDRIRDYTKLMSASQSFISEDALDAYDFGRHSCLMDVGGGNGTFLTAVARRHANLKLRLFDLPAVGGEAERLADSRGLNQKIEVFGGDFFEDSLPTGADAISLVRIIHDHDDDRVLKLLGNVRRALPESGTLILVEPLADSQGRDPITDAYFAFYLLALGSGQARTFDEIQALLEQSGFAGIREHSTRRPLLTRLISARPN